MELQVLKGVNLYIALGAVATLWVLTVSRFDGLLQSWQVANGNVQKLITVFRNPISKVPGPWYTLFTALPNQMSMFKGFTPGHAHKLHQKYGMFPHDTGSSRQHVD